MIPVARVLDVVTVLGIPGIIVTGSINTLTNWRPTARLGDFFWCMLGPGIITGGSSRVMTNMLPTAYLGAPVQLLFLPISGVIVTGSENTFIGI